MNPQTAILYNSPALHALQRKQLISLCKRCNIKAKGKNLDLIRKLQAGEKLPETAKVDPAFALDSFVEVNCPPPASSSPTKPPRPSEPWSVLEGESIDDDADAGAMQVDDLDTGDGTVKGKGSWKSAENGRSELDEFGIPRSTSGVSLTRSTSKTLKSFLSSSLSRSLSRTAGGSTKPPESVLNADMFKEPTLTSPAPPSPEPGVARAMRPSIAGDEPTIRMLDASPSASSSLYPQLPAMEDKRLAPPFPTETRVPGGFPASAFPSTSVAKAPAPAFVFGSPMPSRTAFNFRSPEVSTTFTFAPMALPSAGQTSAPAQGAPRDMRAIMEEEMRKLMAEKGVLDAPPLPSVGNLFSREVFDGLGGKKEIKKRRFDEIHEKEFAKMPSILDHHSARRVAAKSSTPTTTARISSAANPRRPRPSASAASAQARRQQSAAMAGARQPSALPSNATSRIRPTPSASAAQDSTERSQNGRAAKKIKVDRLTTAPPVAPLPSRVNPAVAVLAPATAAPAASSPKVKSSRFGFLTHGVESVKTFLAKPSASAASGSMPRSGSASSIPKLKGKATATVPPPPPAIKQFALGVQKDKGQSLGGMTRSESFQTRPGSTLLAPTASSLAKQASSAKASSVKMPSQALPVRPSLATTRLPLPSTSAARVVSKARTIEAPRVTTSTVAHAKSTSSVAAPPPAAKSPLAASRPSVTNPPASSSKTPLKRGPQFKARVALKLSQRAAAAAAASGSGKQPSVGALARTPGGKQRSSISAALVHKPSASLALNGGLYLRTGVPAKKKGRESVPISSSSTGGARKHSAAGLAGLKARGRTSELARHKPASMLASTPKAPKKLLPKAPTTPLFPAVPIGGIDE